MISFLIGDIISKGSESIVLQNNNVGYRVNTSSNTMLKLEVGEKNALLYTRLIVREDDLSLYGFSNQDELDMFNLLLLVSRIGPRVAIGVLSNLNPIEIKRAILEKDYKLLSTAPGIGKKTAERMILELKDKINEEELLIDDSIEEDKVTDFFQLREAVEALVSLGYKKYEVEKALEGLNTEDMTVEEIIRVGLKLLST